MPLLRVVVACGLCVSASVAVAEDATLPEADFLEYLGSWEESDEDWLILSDAVEAQDETESDAVLDERSDPASADEESTENDDES